MKTWVDDSLKVYTALNLQAHTATSATDSDLSNRYRPLNESDECSCSSGKVNIEAIKVATYLAYPHGA